MHLQRRPQSASPATSGNYRGLYTSYGFLPTKEQPQLAAAQQPQTTLPEVAATTFGPAEKNKQKHPLLARPQTAGPLPNRPVGWDTLQPPLFTNQASPALAAPAPSPERPPSPLGASGLPVGSVHSRDGFASTQQLWHIAMGGHEGGPGVGVAAGMKLAVAKAQVVELSGELADCKGALQSAEARVRSETALKLEREAQVLDLKEQLKIRGWNLAEKSKVRQKKEVTTGSACHFHPCVLTWLDALSCTLPGAARSGRGQRALGGRG